MQKRSRSNLASGIILLIMLAVVIAAVLNRQFIKDYYFANFAKQQIEAMQLANNIALTNRGNFLYKASLPQLEAAYSFNKNCSSVMKEHSIVLGCYSQQKIYVYNVQDERLNGAKEVTAAHELLHATYARLSTKERTSVDRLVKSEIDKLSDPRIIKVIDEYKKSSDDVLRNETYAIIGTEAPGLSPELEKHYGQYFQDRSKIVDFAKQYEEVFTDLEKQADGLKSELDSLKSEIENLDQKVRLSGQKLTADERQMNNLSRTDPQEYNRQVPIFNALVQSYNINLGELKNKISDYNNKVEKYNSLAKTQQDLMHKMDSKYQPTQEPN